MMPVADLYANTLHEQLKQYAAWPPGLSLNLGDYGTLQGSVFAKLGNIKDFGGITINQGTASQSVRWEFKSTGIRETNVAAGGAANVPVSGGVPANVKANLTIDFSSNDAVYFRAEACTWYGIQNQAAINAQIMNLFKQRTWPGDYVFISSLFMAGATTSIVSKEYRPSS